MFNRVNALLEAIDKKAEEIADAANSDEATHALVQQQQQYQDRDMDRGHTHGFSSSHNAASPVRSTALKLPEQLPSLLHDASSAVNDVSATGSHGGLFRNAEPTAATATATATAAAADGTTTAAPSSAFSVASSPRTDPVVMRLQSQCTVLEEEKLKWQMEAATQKTQCSTAREALWKAEQDVRSARAGQRQAEEELEAYRISSKRLLDEALEAAAASSSGAPSLLKANSKATAATATGRDEEDGSATVASVNPEYIRNLETELQRHRVDMERCLDDLTKANAQLQRSQDECRQLQGRVEELDVEVKVAKESLEGETIIGEEERAKLRELQGKYNALLHSRSFSGDTMHPSRINSAASGGATPPFDRSTTDVGGLKEQLTHSEMELNELKQRYQLLSSQASNRQIELDSALRDAAEVKARYAELAKRVADEEVELAAGYGGGRSTVLSASCTSLGRGGPAAAHLRHSHAMSAGGPAAAATVFIPVASHERAAEGGPSSQVNPDDALRRHPFMVLLVRQYGVPGRALVSLICLVDAVALRSGWMLVRGHPAWRVFAITYIFLLQLWVVLLFIVNVVITDEG